MGVQSGLIPLFEMEEGQVIHVRKIKKRVPVGEYLKMQERFRHPFGATEGEKEITQIQALADANIKKFGLVGKPTE